MDGHASGGAPRTSRERVRFYLLDHRTRLGRGIDIALLTLNLVFVGVFVAQSYDISRSTRDVLWRAEIAIAVVFSVEYVLRLYGARDRLDEATDPYTVVDLLSVVPTLLGVVAVGPVLGVNIGFLRTIRVVRVLRFYRFTRDESSSLAPSRSARSGRRSSCSRCS